jgi:hypothetical protein
MRNYKTWWWTAVVFQWITAAFYPFSLLIDAKPANETEKQLFNLMQNYPYNMGGMEVTMQSLFTALGACFFRPAWCFHQAASRRKYRFNPCLLLYSQWCSG